MAYKTLINQINGEIGAIGATLSLELDGVGTATLTVDRPQGAKLVISFGRCEDKDKRIDRIRHEYWLDKSLSMADINVYSRVEPLLSRLVLMYGDYLVDDTCLRIRNGRLHAPFLGLW